MTAGSFGRGRWWQVSRRRSNRIYAPIVLMHASEDGGCVLRGQSSWRTVNGVMVRIGERSGWIIFRRPFRWWRS